MIRTQVPLNDLGRALKAQSEELTSIVADVVARGWLVHGTQHAAFEGELAAYVGVSEGIGVASGTDALELSLRALRVPGRNVVVTAANAGAYTSVAARLAGFEVRYVDVDPATHLLDPAALASLLDEGVAAVVVTHLYGRAADVPELVRMCAPYGVPVVEDCAQAIGAAPDWGRVGSAGTLAAFSFYPTKNLGALGDGGAIVTSDAELAERLRHLRQYGWTGKYTIAVDGGRNSRLDELQAAILRYRLPLVDCWNARRREIITRYEDAAGEHVTVLEARGPYHAAHLAVAVTDDAADLAGHLADRGVGTGVHYPIPDHRQPVFAADHGSTVLPVTDGLVGRILSLPCFPELTEGEVEQVCDGLARY